MEVTDSPGPTIPCCNSHPPSTYLYVKCKRGLASPNFALTIKTFLNFISVAKNVLFTTICFVWSAHEKQLYLDKLLPCFKLARGVVLLLVQSLIENIIEDAVTCFKDGLF